MPDLRPAALLCVLLVTACGGGDDKTAVPTGSAPSASSSAATTSEKLDLCPKISAAEASTALGFTATAGLTPSGDCQYKGDDPRANADATIGVIVLDGSNGDFAQVQSTAVALSGGMAKALDGLGDGAFVVAGNKQFTTAVAAAVVKGNVIQVTLAGGTLADLPAQAEKLLRLAVSKA